MRSLRPSLVRRARLAAVAAAGLAGLIGMLPARGDDLTTLAGQTFHDVRAVRVEPDGVTWQHATGVCKVDLADCPPTVRAAYGYDPARAGAYREAQAQRARQAQEESARLLLAQEERRLQRARAAFDASGQATGLDGRTVFRRGPEATLDTARTVAEQMAAEPGTPRAPVPPPDTGLGAKVLSAVPSLFPLTGHPHFDLPTAQEYRASLAYAPGGFVSDQEQRERFATPLHMTRSYYEDVDRAAAFAHGTPLK